MSDKKLKMKAVFITTIGKFLEKHKMEFISKVVTPELIEKLKFLLVAKKECALLCKKIDYDYYISSSNEETIIIKCNAHNKIKDIFY